MEAERPWLPYHELLTAPAARLVGAPPGGDRGDELAHGQPAPADGLFYRPAGERTRIVIEDSAFPSDSYAVRSQARFHGLDPDDHGGPAAARAPARRPCAPTTCWTTWPAEGDKVALVLLGGVNYLTGELMDIPAITAAGRAAGAVVGWDLAHAAGQRAAALHDWDVDFAAWCSYKYLNSGPGALAGVFVHERHLGRADLPRFEGWWSTEAADPLRDDPGLPAAGHRRGVADLQPADLRDGPGAHLAGALRLRSAWRRCGRAACGSPATWSGCSTRSPPTGR